MFDITECKCKEYNECGCGQTEKIPGALREFVSHQRTLRRLRLPHIILLLNIQENQANDLENILSSNMRIDARVMITMSQ